MAKTLFAFLAQQIRAKPVLGCCMIVSVLFLPALAGTYLFDDYIHLRMLHAYQQHSSFVDHWGLLNLFDFGTEKAQVFESNIGAPWWASANLQIKFWRPLSSALGYLDKTIAPDNPCWAHVHSLLWLCAFVAALRWLLQETCDQGRRDISWVALLTLLIASTSSTLAFVGSWIANRNALISTALTFAGFAAYARGQRDPRARLQGLSALLLAGGLLAGEMTWSALMLWGAFVLWGDCSPWKQRLGRLILHIPVLVAWVVHYVMFDLGAKYGGFYVHPVAEFGKFLQVLPARLAKFMSFGLGFVPPQAVTDPASQGGIILGGIACFALGALAWRVVYRDASPNHRKTLIWTAVGGILSLLPIAGTMPVDRLLVPFVLSSSFLYASLLRWLATRRAKPGYAILLGVGLVRHLVLSPLMTFATSIGFCMLSHALQQHISNFVAALEPNDSTQLRVMLNSPDIALAWSMPSQIAFTQGNDETPWTFGASTRENIVVSRPSARSISLSTGHGNLISGTYGSLLRTKLDNDRDPLKPGKVIERPNFTVRIDALDADAAPTAITITFPQDLAMRSVAFYAWIDNAITPFDLPAIGQSVPLKWTMGPAGI